MRFPFSTSILALALSWCHPAGARVFEDNGGRKVEAELVGVRGDHVVLSRNGNLAQWPVAKLSAQDQAYVASWKKNPPKTPKISVRIWERDGIGPIGKYEETSSGPGLPKNIPMILETEEKEKYKHYDIDLTNTSANLDANHLVMSYILYVIDESGNVIDLPGSESISTIEAGKRVTTQTRGATYLRIKKTQTTLSITNFGITTGSDRSRANQRFGGAWVRVYAADGSMVGEARDLHPEIEKLKPAWTGSTDGKEAFPLLEALEKLGEMIREKLPPLPKGGPPIKPPPLPFPKP